MDECLIDGTKRQSATPFVFSIIYGRAICGGISIERMKGLNFAQGLVRAPWTCRACTRRIRTPVLRTPRSRSYATAAPAARRGLSPGTILVTATIGSAIITAAVYPNDVKHAYQACQRSGRVVVALAKCINEYVLHWKMRLGVWEDANLVIATALRSTITRSRRKTRRRIQRG